jgi:hypothetical protein
MEVYIGSGILSSEFGPTRQPAEGLANKFAATFAKPAFAGSILVAEGRLRSCSPWFQPLGFGCDIVKVVTISLHLC